MNLATKKNLAKDSQSTAASRTSVFTFLRSVPDTKKKSVGSFVGESTLLHEQWLLSRCTGARAGVES